MSDKSKPTAVALKASHLSHKMPGPFIEANTEAELSEAFGLLCEWGLEGLTIAEVRDILNVTSESARLLGDAHSSFTLLLGVDWLRGSCHALGFNLSAGNAPNR